MSGGAPDCVSDITSVVGLAKLRREQPHRWHRDLLATPHEPGAPISELDVEGALRHPALGMLLPTGPDDGGRIRRDRASARRLIGLIGEVSMAEVDEAVLAETRRRLITGDGDDDAVVGGETATRTVSLLRKTARRWAESARLEPRVAERAPTASAPAPRRQPRPTLALGSVQRLLHTAMPVERAAMAFALGGGLKEHEILRLKRSDLLAAPKRTRRPRPGAITAAPVEVLIEVTAPGDAYGPRQFRRAPLPWWACDLVGAPDAGLFGKAQGELLFPHRSDPDRPREGFRSVMARLRLRALGAHAPPVSLTELHRCWQVVARQAKLPREVVRQTWHYSAPPPGRALESRPLDWLRWLAAQWPALMRAPVAGAIANPAVLPRRAPKGVAPEKSELADPWAGWRPLPASAR